MKVTGLHALSYQDNSFSDTSLIFTNKRRMYKLAEGGTGLGVYRVYDRGFGNGR